MDQKPNDSAVSIFVQTNPTEIILTSSPTPEVWLPQVQPGEKK